MKNKILPPLPLVSLIVQIMQRSAGHALPAAVYELTYTVVSRTYAVGVEGGWYYYFSGAQPTCWSTQLEPTHPTRNKMVYSRPFSPLILHHWPSPTFCFLRISQSDNAGKPLESPSFNHVSQKWTEYKEAFALFDKKGTGGVPRETLGDLLRALGQNPTQAEVAEIIASAPREGEFAFRRSYRQLYSVSWVSGL